MSNKHLHRDLNKKYEKEEIMSFSASHDRHNSRLQNRQNCLANDLLSNEGHRKLKSEKSHRFFHTDFNPVLKKGSTIG